MSHIRGWFGDAPFTPRGLPGRSLAAPPPPPGAVQTVVPRRGAHQVAARRCPGTAGPAARSLLGSQTRHKTLTGELWREVGPRQPLGEDTGSGTRVCAAGAPLATPGGAGIPRRGRPASSAFLLRATESILFPKSARDTLQIKVHLSKFTSGIYVAGWGGQDRLERRSE